MIPGGESPAWVFFKAPQMFRCTVTGTAELDNLNSVPWLHIKISACPPHQLTLMPTKRRAFGLVVVPHQSGFDTHPWPLTPASCRCRLWENMVMIQLTGSLPPTRETRIEFRAPGLGPVPAQAIASIWRNSQQMGAGSLALSASQVSFKKKKNAWKPI